MGYPYSRVHSVSFNVADLRFVQLPVRAFILGEPVHCFHSLPNGGG